MKRNTQILAGACLLLLACTADPVALDGGTDAGGPPDPPCVPLTCEDAGAACGTVDDGCGGELFCGGCGAGVLCIANLCQDPREAPTACETSADCGEDAHCAENGRCFMTCERHLDCPRSAICDDADGDGLADECLPGAVGAGKVGEPCLENWDCAGGREARCVRDEGWVDGYCVDFDCTVGWVCSEVGACVQGANGDEFCLARCETHADCREGYACKSQPDSRYRVCLPGACRFDEDCPAETPLCTSEGTCGTCRTDDDCPDPGRGWCPLSVGRCSECRTSAHCPEGMVCDAGACVPGAGSACTVDADCGPDLRCLTEAYTGLNGGLCTRACRENTDCGADGTCGVADGRCYRACASDDDCRPGWGCYDPDLDGFTQCVSLGVGEVPVGGACARDADCAGGVHARCAAPELEAEVGWPLGRVCTLPCQTTPCPEGSRCLWRDTGPALCYPLCPESRVCGEGYACYTFWEKEACWPVTGCASGADCVSGVCRAGACVGCDDDADCGGGRCEAASGYCVECLEDGDCVGEAACDGATGRCVL